MNDSPKDETIPCSSTCMSIFNISGLKGLQNYTKPAELSFDFGVEEEEMTWLTND